MKPYSYILAFCLCLSSLVIKAQFYNDDAKLWLYVKLDKDIIKKLNAEITIQNRIEGNISKYSKLYGNLELTYKLNKNFRVVGGYGYGKNDRLDGSYGDRHRLYAGIVLRKKIKSFLFTYRNIFQGSVKNIYTSESGAVPLYFDRNKVTIKYELNKLFDIYTAHEVNLSYNQVKYDNIARYRAYAGGVYNLSKKSNLEAYFMFQRKYTFNGQPKRDFVFGLTYSHSF